MRYKESLFMAIGCLLGAGALSVPAWAVDSARSGTAYPGTLNYVEGQASIGAQALSSKSVGSVQLASGQSLTTERGKAEILLTPGVFLRVGDNSALKMISPSLTDTEAQLRRGEATVEVTQIYPQNNLRIDVGGSRTRLLKNGFYDFDANESQIRVLDGEALVQAGDRQIKVKGGHEVDLGAARIKSRGFDKKSYEAGDLYKWSSLRSAYLAEANADIAPAYVVNGWYGPGWIGAGWYWDPWFGCYTFLPADGIFYSPFGWGFYSPIWAFTYYRGFSGPRYQHHFALDPHAWGPGLRRAPVVRGGTFRGLAPSSPLRSSPRGFRNFRGGSPGGFRGFGSFPGAGPRVFQGRGFGGPHGRGLQRGPGR